MIDENEFGQALLRGEEPIDLAALTARVLRRDRRRIWLLGAASFISWMLVVMLPWATTMPMLAKVVTYQEQISRPADSTAHPPPIQMRELLQIIRRATVATFVGSVASMFFAALSTVSLIIVSRRATLRQVNARLAEISIHLKKLAGA